MAASAKDIPLISPYSPRNFRSYRDFLHTQGNHWESQWLQEFFKGKSKDGETFTAILDCEAGEITEPPLHIILAGQLRNLPPGVSTRLIIVSHENSWDVDRDILDSIGLALDVAPALFQAHFDHSDEAADEFYSEKPRDTFGELKQHLLGSDQTFLHFQDAGGWYCLTIQICPVSPTATISERLSPMQNRLLADDFAPKVLILFRDAAFANGWPSIANLSTESPNALLRRKMTGPLPSYEETAHGAFPSHILKSLPKSERLSAEQRPIEFICPLVRVIASKLAETIANAKKDLSYLSSEPLSVDFRRSRNVGFRNRMARLAREQQALYEGIQSLLIMANRNSGRLATRSAHTPASASANTSKDVPRPDKVRILIEDLQGLKTDFAQMSQTLSNITFMDVNFMSLTEARNSIEEAKSVKSLSQLAFVFIPLTFVTSVFGMNLQPLLETGGAQVWVYMLSTVVVSAISFLLWNNASSLDRWYHGYFTGWQMRVKMLFRFFLIFPGHALVLMLFCISHNASKNDKCLHDLRIKYYLYERGMNNIVTRYYAEPRVESQEVWYKNFWLRRMDHIAALTVRNGYDWPRQTLWWRLKRTTSSFGKRIKQAFSGVQRDGTIGIEEAVAMGS